MPEANAPLMVTRAVLLAIYTLYIAILSELWKIILFNEPKGRILLRRSKLRAASRREARKV
ncbi:hypothetical protein [Nostoc sp.]|uniref:hypothetical protein n=1 Tax=Nostoc sp. TaxID=1180 RepID=UPI002FF56C35